MILCKKLHFSLKWQLLTPSLRICVSLEIPRNTATTGQDSALHVKIWSASHTPTFQVSVLLPAQELSGLQLKQEQPESWVSLCYAGDTHSGLTGISHHFSLIPTAHVGIHTAKIPHKHWNSVVWCGKVIRVIFKIVKIWLKLLCAFPNTENICKIMQRNL